jgi:hypothetical protein
MLMTLLFKTLFWIVEGTLKFERSLDYCSGTPPNSHPIVRRAWYALTTIKFVQKMAAPLPS